MKKKIRGEMRKINKDRSKKKSFENRKKRKKNTEEKKKQRKQLQQVNHLQLREKPSQANLQ